MKTLDWILLAGVFAVLAGLAGCSAAVAPSSPCAFGSPTRTAHALACIPYALGAGAKDAAMIEQADKVKASDVLGALDKKVQAGDATAAVSACGPYVADLVCAGNADAAAMQTRLKAAKTQ